MPGRIEDYALIGNRSSTALVDRNGSIDWLTFPRFDSAACFAALLGKPENGFWKIAPRDSKATVKRRYRPGTLVLETEFSTSSGKVILTDCMDRRNTNGNVLRWVRCEEGRVPIQSELCARFDYGHSWPWINRLQDGRVQLIAGPDQLIFATNASIEIRDENLYSDFTLERGEELGFSLVWEKSFRKPPESPQPAISIETVSKSWKAWSAQFKSKGPWDDAVLRSLITLQALTDQDTGGMVAAPTTSLPEEIGGARNWDYRYCWLRDATFTLYALLESGYKDESRDWRDWLIRAVAGAPDQMQTLYGVGGERRLSEQELGWLDGYEGSKPVRIGNAATEQLQLDIYGEVMDLLYLADREGIPSVQAQWEIQTRMTEHIAGIWNQPDQGIWEVRGGPRHFTYSKVMTWVTMDRAVRSVEEFGRPGPVDRWRQVRGQIHAEVCQKGFDRELGAFVQYFGAKTLDASLLLMAQVGFLLANDERVKGTVAAIAKHLMVDGLIRRYDPATGVDGVPGTEGVFLPCSFWLADNYVLQGRESEARDLFERLLALRNDVGLLSEEYDPASKRLVGNFPQAFSHVALVNTALNLTREKRPSEHRAGGAGYQTQ